MWEHVVAVVSKVCGLVELGSSVETVRGAGWSLVGGDRGRGCGQGRGGEPGGLGWTWSRVSGWGRRAGGRRERRSQVGERRPGSCGEGEVRVEVVCGGSADLSGWFLALEIARASILKPDLLKRMNSGQFS